MIYPLERHTRAVIEREGLLRRGAPVIVALSGGADSVALLSVLCALGYECIAAHCNFHLRGEESVRDMRHAERIAKHLGVDIYIREFNVAERVKRTGESVEMACRTLRYDWFHDLLDRDYSQAIAVAHHREDNIETFFLNLMRTTGLRGLTGMDYRRGYVVRPFLDVSRTDIEQYLAEKGLEYVVDSSNESNDFKRNRLRNCILPSIKEHFPIVENAVLETISHLRDARLILDDAVGRVKAQYMTDEEHLDIASLNMSYDSATGRAFVFEMLYPKGFTSTQVDNIVDAVKDGRTGLHFDLPDGLVAELDRGILTIMPKDKSALTDRAHAVNLRHDILKPVHIEVSEHDIVEFHPTRDINVIYLDVRAVSPDASFEIRSPRVGDRMQPYGMNGERLVSDILKDAKFTAAQKRNTLVLTRNGVILWIIGLRASAHFSLTPKTRRYLRLQLNP